MLAWTHGHDIVWNMGLEAKAAISSPIKVFALSTAGFPKPCTKYSMIDVISRTLGCDLFLGISRVVRLKVCRSIILKLFRGRDCFTILC